MSLEKNRKAGEHLNAFMDTIYADLEKEAGSAVSKFEQRVGQIDKRFDFVEEQINKLRSDVGSIKNDVARGDGKLKTFTIPKKKGGLKYVIGGQVCEATVDEKGNVVGKNVASHNIGSHQVEVVLNAPLDNDSAVSFYEGNIKDVVADLESGMINVKNMQQTMSDTIVNVQKNFDDSIRAVKKKIDEFIDNKNKEEIEQINKSLDMLNTKLDRINKKLVGAGNILKEEGLIKG